ncbi:putative bifunctional diguanylate cyclase/phosphodiesterase [Bauldia litoralis]|uniref:Diguanylate cyclase/phosphodiesterase n=1 Tax=Bauldia litoralis TaxID=665467 RepID=A0A1G6ACJ0_9HYPH|nr:EAL domain-containing protein [Bauldia litoralis]SDB06036.1 diguanylate cyclase/phosphodiesterase [Bauldia litoralis]
MNTTLGRIRSAFSSLPARATLVLLTFVSIGIVVMGCVGYLKLDEATRDNAEVRIDRAARAAAAITAGTFAGMFLIERDDTGTPLAIRLSPGLDAAFLKTSPKFDALVEEIAATNQGSANVFCLNRETMLFDRFATTLRNPDGSLARNASLGEAHAAYASLLAGRHYTGEVRVLDRFRLAYLTPMLDSGGTVVGALAVDVGWVDDLVRARTELQSDILISTALLLFVVTTIGAYLLYRAFRPLRAIGAFAHRVAIGEVDADVPYLGRKDEIGTLAAGMAQVVSMQNKLEQLAYYDQLTGVFNRSRFLRSLDAIFEAGEPSSAALLVVDIDGFRGVNEAFGHAAGDALVAQVAAALKAELRPGETLSRIGGNEFAIVTEGRTGAGDVEALAAAVLQRMAKPFRLPQAEVQTGCSIGIVLLPANARSTQDAIRNAELALNQAKTGGRGRYCFFTDEMSEAASNRAVTTRALREAIDADELTLHFQPQIRSADFGLFGVEALARWHHATRGDIPPAEFIPIAEESGLIIDLGKVVLNHSCRVARQWLDDGFDFQRISVNVSPTQIRQSDFRAVVVAALEAANLPARYLCLEVTESVFVNHGDRTVLRTVEALRELGVSLSLDDFGTGYSSLGYLNRLPFNQLKIDRSFVTDIDSDEQRKNLLNGMVALGKGLGMQIVAEGAETEAEVVVLCAAGCDAIQGYFFSRPVPVGSLPAEVERVSETARTAFARNGIRLAVS